MSDTTTADRSLLPDLGDTWGRFPLAVIAILAFTAYHLVFPDLTFQFGDTIASNIGIALSGAFLAGVSAQLFAEARGLERVAGLVAGSAAIALVVALCLAGRRIELRPWQLFGGLQLLVGLAPFVPGRAANAEFWEFNHRLWIAWAMSVLATLMFGLGALAIAETLHYLFGVVLPTFLHQRIWVIAAGFIGPVYWLAQIPRRFDVPAVVAPQTETISQMVAVLAKFIVVPLLLVYAVILHAYAVKIGIDRALPHGRLGWMVSWFAGITALGALITYPTHASGGPVVALFWRWWPWLLAVPLGLLLIAAGQRVAQHGLTEPRYLILLVGLWIAAMIASQGVLGRDLRLIPGVIAVLLVAVSFGPWGSQGFPARRQVAVLKTRLEQTGLATRGVLSADSKTAAAKLGDADRAVVGNITYYLWQIDRLDALKPVFAGQPNDPFTKEISPHTIQQAPYVWQARAALRGLINERLGLPSDYAPGSKTPPFSYYSAVAPWLIATHGSAHVAGTFNLDKTLGEQSVANAGIGVKFDGSSVIVTHVADGRVARFDLAANTALLAKLAAPVPALPTKRGVIQLARTSGELAAELWIVSSALRREAKGELTITALSVFVVLEDAVGAKAP